MKIKLAVIVSDEKYLTRFVDMLTLRYADKMELSVFTKVAGSGEIIKKYRPDIILVEKHFLEEAFSAPGNSQVVCFTEEKDIHIWNGYRAICKYQKISGIYKNIVDIYAEKMETEALTLNKDDKKIVTFFSGAGGVGASTVAASYAFHLAQQGEKVLYLNLEQTGDAGQFFSAEGDEDFGKVIYALEMKNGQPSVRMESALRRDASGVYFYAACVSALDMLELNTDIMERMFEELSVIKLFHWIIVDMDFCLSTAVYMQIERSYATYFVSDGSSTANAKLGRKLAALEIVAEQRERMLLNRIFILYNRFGSKSGKKLEGCAFKEIGGIHRFADAKAEDLLKLISQTEVFDGMQE